MVPFYVIGKVQYVFASRHPRRHSARSFSVTSFPYLATSLPPYLLFSDFSPATHFRRSYRSENVQTCQRSDVLTSFTAKSLPFNLFADSHPLTPVTSDFYKNAGGRGHSRRFLSPKAFPCHTSENSPVSPLAATLMDLPASVANKRLTVGLSPLDATLTRNRGGTSFKPKGSLPPRLSCSSDVQTFPHANVSTCFPAILFPFNRLRTLLHNGRHVSAFLSITCALFPSRRRVYPPPLPTLELTPCVSPGLPAPLYLLFSYSYVEPILQALYFHIHPCNGGCTLLPGVSTGYRLLPIITYPQGFSASKKSKKMSQLRAVWRLFALVEEPGASGSAGSGISVGSVPRFAVNRLDRFQLFLRKRLIHCGKFLGNEGVEFAGHVIQFLLERIDARTLVIGWTPLIVQKSSVECRRFFADAFLAGDGASFRRGHDLLAHGFYFAGEFLQPLAEDGVCLQLCAALHQPGVYAVNAVDIEAHFPEP